MREALALNFAADKSTTATMFRKNAIKMIVSLIGLVLLTTNAKAQQIMAVPVVSPTTSNQPAESWIRFDASGLLASGTGGVTNRTTPRSVTIEDKVRIASISKMVMALGVMRLVEDHKLSLDKDVSDYLGWRLRNPAFPNRKITMAMLLSHTSSLNDNGEAYLVPLGNSMEQTMADPAMWDRAHMPGRYFTYGNINFGVAGSIIERITGERFDHAMDRLVIKPLSLKACYNWGGVCSERDAVRAITLYRPNGDVARDDLNGKLPSCLVFVKEGASCDIMSYQIGTNGALFSPQGGLHISPKDLAEIGRMMLRGGIAADGTRFLKAASITTMQRPRWIYDGSNGTTDSGFYCAYGLATQILGVSQAPQCRDRLPGLSTGSFGHAGDAYNLKAGLWIDPKSKTGITYYATTVNDTTPDIGPSAFTVTEQRMAGK